MASDGTEGGVDMLAARAAPAGNEGELATPSGRVESEGRVLHSSSLDASKEVCARKLYFIVCGKQRAASARASCCASSAAHACGCCAGAPARAPEPAVAVAAGPIRLQHLPGGGARPSGDALRTPILLAMPL